MAENTAAGKAPATPESVKAQAEALEEKEDLAGGAKHFDQPGVRFSFQELRDYEFNRKKETGESFRQHVEVALLTLRALHNMAPPESAEFRKKIKFNDFDNKPENKTPAPQLTAWLDQVQSGARVGGGAAAAFAAREAAQRKEIDDLKATIAKMQAEKSKK